MDIRDEDREAFSKFMRQERSWNRARPLTSGASIYGLQTDFLGSPPGDIFYIGVAVNIERRKQEHLCCETRAEDLALIINARQNSSIKELRLYREYIILRSEELEMKELEVVEAGRPYYAYERERRWIFSTLQKNRPFSTSFLTNKEGLLPNMVMALRITKNLDVLNEPLESLAWDPIIEGLIKDVEVLTAYSAILS